MQAKPDTLLYGPDPKREPRSFRLSWSRELGAKRGKGPGSFVHDSKQQTTDFYQLVVQHLRAWNAPAPKFLVEPGPTTDEASPTPPDFASDSRDFGDATQPAE